MQKIDSVDYKNKLNESVGLDKQTKIGTAHYFDDGKIQRWYVLDESTDKNILAYVDTPEELLLKSSLTISNINDVNKVISYRKIKNVTESKVSDRLFYLDTLYGSNNNKLRAKLKESNQLPASEKSYAEIIAELDAYPSAPAPAPSQPEGVSKVPVQGSPSGDITNAVGGEIDFILSDMFDDVLSRVKGLRTEVYAEDAHKQLMAHYFYENLYDMREKIIKALKDRISEQLGQPSTSPAQPNSTPTPKV